MRRILTDALALSTLALGVLAPAAEAETLYGLTTDNRIVIFDSQTPGNASGRSLSGLRAGESLLGIDFRPNGNDLYGLGNLGGLYTIDPRSGAATLRVGGLVDAGGLPVTPSGTSFGTDFNPQVDRLRLNSNVGQNVAINVDNGVSAVQGQLNPPAGQRGVVGAAYTNNQPNAPSTTLYDIDADNDILVTQVPPAGGTLNQVGAGLGFDTNELVGFEISGVSGLAFASLTAPGAGTSQLFLIDLDGGAASLLGGIGAATPLIGLTASTVPVPGTILLMGAGLTLVAALLGRRARA